MPELGTSEKKKREKRVSTKGEVVSAYSEEGKARNAATAKANKRFIILFIASGVLMLFAAIVLLIVGMNLGWV